MESAPENPPANILGAGVDEEAVAAAVKLSGYPLQTVVGRALNRQFGVQEEWSYIDSDTHEQRTIDIHAGHALYDFHSGSAQLRVRPALDLLIECKQSALPYVFFLSDSTPRLTEFPTVAGLAGDHISISTDDSASTWTFGILDALGLTSHRFLTQPKYSSTFSKCVRKGGDIVLSGSESYSSLVLPLLKAVAHFYETAHPPSTAAYFDAHLVIGVGVLDAPMIGVHVQQDNSAKLVLLPWVRVLRHESLEGKHPFERSRLRALDVVHRDYLSAYVENAVIPFANDFAAVAQKNHVPIADAEAFVSGMANDSHRDIVARLEPKTVKRKLNRGAAIVRRVLGEDQD